MTQPSRLIVKPRDPKLCIRDPKTKKRLPQRAAAVPATSYWHRRLRDGDVIELDSVPKRKVEKVKTPPTTKAEAEKRAKAAEKSAADKAKE